MLTEDEETTIGNFFLHSYILMYDVTRVVAENARQLARRYGQGPMTLCTWLQLCFLTQTCSRPGIQEILRESRESP